MSGEKNIFSCITTEGKRAGKRSLIQYLEKNTGVFNHNGMLGKEQVKEMQARAQANKGFIWHGFISLNEHDSEKINTTEKSIELVKRPFRRFSKKRI